MLLLRCIADDPQIALDLNEDEGLDEDEGRLPLLDPLCAQDPMHPNAQARTIPPLDNVGVPPEVTLLGLRREDHPNKPRSFKGGKNLLEVIQCDTYAECRRDNIHYPFRSREEWQLAEWLTNSPLTQAQIDSFLKLEEVCIFSLPRSLKLIFSA